MMGFYYDNEQNRYWLDNSKIPLMNNFKHSQRKMERFLFFYTFLKEHKLEKTFQELYIKCLFWGTIAYSYRYSIY